MSHNFILERLEAIDTTSFHSSECLIRGLWQFRGASSIDAFDSTGFTPMHYAFHLVLTGSVLGCCYTQTLAIEPPNPLWIGQDARSLQPTAIVDRIALVDSVLGQFNRLPECTVTLAGTPKEKSDERAKIIASEVNSLAKEKGIQQASVLMVGVVGKVMTAMRDHGLKVQGIDLNPNVVGQKSGGVTIIDGSQTAALLPTVDIALVSGMALLDASLDMILATCNLLKVPIVMYAQTGSNCAPFYLEWGIARVVAESFPIYVLQGDSRIRIYR